tara:strand:- start:20840 stop:21064 length:225 start_codon:yes stop_codon:yes gene_type:complete
MVNILQFFVVIINYDKMNENENIQEASRLVFSFTLPGVAFKEGALATKAVGGIIHKAAVAVENALPKYGVKAQL